MPTLEGSHKVNMRTRSNFALAIIALMTQFINCDLGPNPPTRHPCNFPDYDTQTGVSYPLTYKIIDKNTFVNLIDTTKNALINADSVRLFDEQFNELPSLSGESHIYKYYIDNWVFTNFYLYHGMPGLWEDPEAYTKLTKRTFYLEDFN